MATAQQPQTVSVTGSSVWQAASAATPGATIKVDYDSTRSDEPQTVVGEVERVSGIYAEGVLKIIFRRDDGQYMAVANDGAVESIGSHYPRTGTVVSVEVAG